MRLKFSISLMILISILSFLSCDNSSNNLQKKLNEYLLSYQNGDYVKMSSFVLPSVIEKFGGTQEFVKTMNSLPESFRSMGMEVDLKNMKFGEVGKIFNKSNYMISVIPTTLPIKVNGSDGKIKSSLICFSEDKGETWFFIEGNDDGRIAISNTNPEIIQMITVPVTELEIDGKNLVQKGGQWVEK
jgi:hypothetical protein